MRFLILFVFSLFSSYSVFAACSDQPANEVDWTNCNFVENLDLSGTGLANSQMSGVNLSLSNFEKSQLNNSNLSIGNFIFSNSISTVHFCKNPFYFFSSIHILALIKLGYVLKTFR